MSECWKNGGLAAALSSQVSSNPTGKNFIKPEQGGYGYRGILIMNHVNLKKLNELVETVKKDPENAKLNPKITGKWIFEMNQPQFRSIMDIEGKQFTVDADMPTKLGGWGTKPGPLHYCLYGLASCYVSTFATLAAMEGVTLKRLEIEAESQVDFSKVLGLSEKPIVEGVKWRVKVSSDAPKEKIEMLKKLAEERCPAVYCLTNPIKLTINLTTL